MNLKLVRISFSYSTVRETPSDLKKKVVALDPVIKSDMIKDTNNTVSIVSITIVVVMKNDCLLTPKSVSRCIFI